MFTRVLRRLLPPLFALTLSTWAGGAAATEPETKPLEPVFEGHRLVSVYTKEVSLEGSFTRLGDGSLAGSGGAAIAQFYTRWFGVIGGANFTPAWFGTRQHYDTRGGFRFVWPDAVAGRLFPFASTGLTVMFYETEAGSKIYDRTLGGYLGLGAFLHVAERVRFRIELRDHWLPSRPEMRHNVFCTLALALSVR
jgi:hypothetical protein